jgi:hypothetical protein
MQLGYMQIEMLAFAIIIVTLTIIFVNYRRQRFYSEMETWQNNYTAIRPPLVPKHKGEFLLN